MSGRLVERGIAHRPEQHGVGLDHRFTRRFGQWIARGRHSRRSDGKVLQRHVNPEPLGDCLEHPLGFGDHFRPDAIAGEDRDAVRFHHVSPFPGLVSRLLSYAPIRSSSSNVLPMTSSPRSNMSRR